MELAVVTTAVILTIIGFVSEKYIVNALRQKIALSALLAGSFLISAGGFQVSEAVGLFCSAAVLLLIAFLFGYDRG